VPEKATATKRPFPHATEDQLLSEAGTRGVHATPSGDVMTPLFTLFEATATNSSCPGKPPYDTERH
jgi:hypothetical protein